MKHNWLTGKSFLVIVLIMFAIGFFVESQYLISLLTITLIVIFTRFAELKKFSVGAQGINAEFSKINKEFREIINSTASSKEKLVKSQKIIDEIFKLGYQAGGGRFNDIWGVNIDRDEKGNVKGIKYNEN